MLDLLEIIGEIARPFVRGEYSADWQARAAQLSAISDFYALRRRDDPFFEEKDEAIGAPFGSRSVLRAMLVEWLPRAMAQTTIGYASEVGVAQGLEREALERTYRGVDSVEKMAMSCIAHALCHHRPSTAQAVTLSGLLYDEALHLCALTRLLDLRHDEQPWITDKRAPFWDLTRASHNLFEYVFLQHCLSEAEGCVSAAHSLFEMRIMGVQDSVTYAVARRIYVEETSHALAGYELLKELDEGYSEQRFREVVARYLTVERPVDSESPKGIRQRFSLHVAETYIRTRSLRVVSDLILGNARSFAENGHALVPFEDLRATARRFAAA